MSQHVAEHEALRPADPRRWAALVIVLLAVLMDLIDVTIVLVAAPTIQADLGTSRSSIQWVIAAYALSLGLLLITGGRLGDILGRKRMFLIGVIGFTVASAACGLAQNIGMLITARAVQGASAAMMVPQVLATIQVSFSREEQPAAYGIYGAVNGLAAAAAPIVGGLLVRYDVFGLAWRSVFWVNVPIGLIALVGAAALMRESRAPRASRLDIVGIVIVTAGLLLLLYPLIQGDHLGWPAWVWVMMAASVPVLGVFGWAQARRERARAGTGRRDAAPLVPVSLFRRRSFLAGIVVAFVMFSSIGSMFLVLTIQLQEGHHASALRAGLIFMAWPIGLLLTSGLAVRFVGTAGRRLVSFGALLLAIGMVTLIVSIDMSDGDPGAWTLMPGLFLGGLGFGLVAPILVDIVLSAVPSEDVGAASGVVNTMIQVSGAVGIALVGTLFSVFLEDKHSFDAAAQWALGYPVAAFVLSFLLSGALPARARAEQS